MHKNGNTISRLSIHGYTINPLIDESHFKNVFFGITTYKSKHSCDFNGDAIHDNYLGKRIGDISVRQIGSDISPSFSGHAVLENGHVTLRTVNSVFPAEIYLDVFLFEDIKDPDLLIDHLRAPAMNHDGFGMFDYTYRIDKEDIAEHHMSKFNKPAAYDKLNFSDVPELSKLPRVECYYCSNQAVSWVFKDNNTRPGFKSVPSCHEHLNRDGVRLGEVINDIMDGKPASDMFKHFVRKDVLDNEGNFLYTINEFFEE